VNFAGQEPDTMSCSFERFSICCLVKKRGEEKCRRKKENGGSRYGRFLKSGGHFFKIDQSVNFR